MQNNTPASHVFLSYASENQESVEALAQRLRGDARLDFFFAPWHERPGEPIQEQLEAALSRAQSCAVFLSGTSAPIEYQYEAMRVAIQTRVEDDKSYRVIPVILPPLEQFNK